MKPQFTLKVLKYLPQIIGSKLANKKKVEAFMKARKHMDQPIIPTKKDEGQQGMMEEGMWYVIFDANGDGTWDSALRYFWVNAPAIKVTVNDLFLVSEVLKGRRASKMYSRTDVIVTEPGRANIVGKAEEFEYHFTGTYHEGYKLVFNDRGTNIEGEVIYKPHPKGVLFYNNAKLVPSPTLYIRYYDIFLCYLSGWVKVDGKEYDLSNARGIIEHAGGLFDTRAITSWEWLNMQFPEGAAHMFFATMSFGKEGSIQINEGAAMLDDQFMHFLGDDMKMEPQEYKFNEVFQKETAVKWKLTAESPKGHKVDLELVSKGDFHFYGDISRELVSEFMLDVKGTIGDKKVHGKGTMETIIR